MIYKIPPKYANLRPFGSRCYFYDKDPQKAKFAPRGYEGIMLGYTERIDGYRVLEVGTQTIHLTKDVRFIDDTLPIEIPNNVDFFDDDDESPESDRRSDPSDRSLPQPVDREKRVLSLSQPARMNLRSRTHIRPP